MFSQRSLQCPVLVAKVTLFRQTHRYSGMGSTAVHVQHDHSCSRESACEHRMTDACMVRKLNAS